MADDAGSGSRRWVLIAILIITPVLLLVCGVGSCCLYAGFGMRSAVVDAAAQAESYRGRPIGDCYDAAFEQMERCSNTDFGCRVAGQALFTQCTHVADFTPEFCDEQADPRSYCDAHCSTATDRYTCQQVCGQLSVPVAQYCARP